MKSKDNMEERVRNAGIVVDAETNTKVFDNAVQAFKRSKAYESGAGALKIRRPIMKRTITRFASVVAVVLVGIMLLWREGGMTGKAYGLAKALEHYEQARIIHIKGLTFFAKDTPEGQQLHGLPHEKWIDREQGRFRYSHYSGSHGTDPGSFGEDPFERPRQRLSVSDGQYLMKTGWRQLFVDQTSDELGPPKRTARFRDLSPFQQRLQMRSMQSILGYYNVRDVAGFTKIGTETIGGEAWDMWQGEVTAAGDIIPYTKLRVWLSPASGAIRQKWEWKNTLQDANEVSWRLKSISNFEYKATPPEGCFDTVAPVGTECDNTKETATRLDLGMWNDDGVGFYTCIGFHLKDGSILLGWHARPRGQGSQEELFKDLEAGGSLPNLPAQITRLVPWPTKEDVAYTGYHWAHTQKADKFYEWSIYVSNKTASEQSMFTRFKTVREFHNCSSRDFGGAPNHIGDAISVDAKEDFDSWVLAAMAELSDDGKAPADVSYDKVMKLSETLRRRLQKK